jgi:phosphate starvation-inducible PhoH-like protein
MEYRMATTKTKKTRQTAPTFELDELQPAEIVTLTHNQKRYLNSIKTNVLTFGTGSAGTGKSYVAIAYAAELLKAKKINKIVLTRPIQEAGEHLGFLPGELEEKTLPYLQPMLDILNKRLGASFTEYLFKRKIIEFRPLAYMRGSTFEDSFIILDEAQNCTPTQLRMFLTRIGENSKVVVDGDVQQKDIKGLSGLDDALTRLKHLNNVGWVHFDIDDIVRSGICKDIVIAYAD